MAFTNNSTNNTCTAKQSLPAGAYVSGGAIEEAVFSNGNSGTSPSAINIDNGNLQSIKITGACTLSFATPTNPGKMMLIITQDGSGHVYSTTGIKYPGGTPPTWSTAANKIDILSIAYDGTNFYGVGNAAFS